MKAHIYSTLSASVAYTLWGKAGADLPKRVRSVTIHGGANVADKHFVTPEGVMTTVSEEELDLLKQNALFQKHLANGFLTIQESAVTVEKAVRELEAADGSAPATPQSFAEKGNGATPVPESTSKRRA